MNPVLHQFASSHFNEKARWALDWKGIAHDRKSYLPGPHFASIPRLSGQSQTPVLALDGEIIPGSAAIIDALERRHPDPPLYPADAAERERALELQESFDGELGPAVRTAIFSVLIKEGGHLCRTFSKGQSALVRGFYRASFPVVRGLMAKANGVEDPENIERALATTAATLDRVADRSAASGYLVGERFTVADLTAAALFAPLAEVDHPDMARPKPVPATITRLLESYASHPAIEWVQTIYAKHRTAPR